MSGSVWCRVDFAGQALQQRDQPGFEFATQNGAGSDAAQVGFVQRRIEPVAADVRGGIESANFLDDFGREPGGGVHRQVEGDQIGFTNAVRV